jgi:hypothetical protein
MPSLPRHETRQHPWFQVLHSREMNLLDPDVRSDAKRVRDLLHDDIVEFGSTGRVYNKRMLLDMMQKETSARVVIRDFVLRQVGAETALVTYRTVGDSGQQVRRSSVWVRQAGIWRMVFHQGTRIALNGPQGRVL